MTKTLATLAALALRRLRIDRSTPRPTVAPPGRGGGDIQVLKVQGNVYMLVGPGGNTALQVGDVGVLVVDTQVASASDKLLAAIRSISPKPIHYIINTNGRGDAIGGNAALAKAGPDDGRIARRFRRASAATSRRRPRSSPTKTCSTA